MRLKKHTRKRKIQRIEKRRTRNFIQAVLLTVALSFLGVVLSFLFVKKPTVISPLPEATLGIRDDLPGVIEGELKKQNIHPQRIISGADGIVVQLEGNQEVILSPTRGISSQLASLQLIMRQLTMEGKRFSRLDLRFEKPVVIAH